MFLRRAAGSSILLQVLLALKVSPIKEETSPACLWAGLGDVEIRRVNSQHLTHTLLTLELPHLKSASLEFRQLWNPSGCF